MQRASRVAVVSPHRPRKKKTTRKAKKKKTKSKKTVKATDRVSRFTALHGALEKGRREDLDVGRKAVEVIPSLSGSDLKRIFKIFGVETNESDEDYDPEENPNNSGSDDGSDDTDPDPDDSSDDSYDPTDDEPDVPTEADLIESARGYIKARYSNATNPSEEETSPPRIMVLELPALHSQTESRIREALFLADYSSDAPHERMSIHPTINVCYQVMYGTIVHNMTNIKCCKALFNKQASKLKKDVTALRTQSTAMDSLLVNHNCLGSIARSVSSLVESYDFSSTTTISKSKDEFVESCNSALRDAHKAKLFGNVPNGTPTDLCRRYIALGKASSGHMHLVVFFMAAAYAHSSFMSDQGDSLVRTYNIVSRRSPSGLDVKKEYFANFCEVACSIIKDDETWKKVDELCACGQFNSRFEPYYMYFSEQVEAAADRRKKAMTVLVLVVGADLLQQMFPAAILGEEPLCNIIFRHSVSFLSSNSGFRFIQSSVYAVGGEDENGKQILSIEDQEGGKYAELEAAIKKWASGDGRDHYSNKYVMFDFNRPEKDLLRQLNVVGYCYCNEEGSGGSDSNSADGSSSDSSSTDGSSSDSSDSSGDDSGSDSDDAGDGSSDD